jgi:hypothetical protein
VARFNKCINEEVQSCVLDCEAVAWNRENKVIQPFQILSTRKRKVSQVTWAKYINSIGMLDSHSDTAHVQGWQFVTSLVESKASDSSSVRMVQM